MLHAAAGLRTIRPQLEFLIQRTPTQVHLRAFCAGQQNVRTGGEMANYSKNDFPYARPQALGKRLEQAQSC